MMLGNGKTYESILNDLGNSKRSWLELLEYNNVHPIWLQKLDFLLKNEADKLYRETDLETVKLETLVRLCDTFQCKLSELVEYVPGE